jgi:hypothetical protein
MSDEERTSVGSFALAVAEGDNPEALEPLSPFR